MFKDQKLIWGGVVSLVLLAVFLLLQVHYPELMKLAIHWVALAALPFIFALIAGGYVSSFKGFGLEIVAALKRPFPEENIHTIDKTLKDAEFTDLFQEHGTDKDSIDRLNAFDAELKKKFTFLTFRERQEPYYTVDAISAYLQSLPNLEYLEILQSDKKFRTILPIGHYRELREGGYFGINRDNIEKLIEALEGSNQYEEQLPHARVLSDEGLKAILLKMDTEDVEYAAVEARNGRYLGIIRANDVARRIAGEVVAIAEAAPSTN